MIVLFTDFGLQGPYTGQMKAVLHQMAPGIAIIDLFADAPAGNPKASAYLLAAYAQWFAAGTTFLCVVDPGVGGARPPVVVEADGRWYVGPGNGLFELIERRAECSHGAVQNGRAMRGVTPALSACRRPLHRRLVESGKPTASPRRSPETRMASLKIINDARARESLASLLVLLGASGPHKAA